MKFQAQDSFLEYFFFGDLKKRIALSEKKPPLPLGTSNLQNWAHFGVSKYLVVKEPHIFLEIVCKYVIVPQIQVLTQSPTYLCWNAKKKWIEF